MVPNLDAMPHDELMIFWSKYHRPTRADAAELIGSRRKGYISLTEDLANYACNKAVAMTCRLKGDIQAASIYESVCERIYSMLPSDARW